MKSLSSYINESKKSIKPSVENLVKALKLCAQAHNVEFCDWLESDGQVALKSEKVPVQADVISICKSFYGNNADVEVGYGYTNVFVHTDFLSKVSMMELEMALPNGWIDKI